MRPDHYPYGTHCEYIASTGGGKSKGAGYNARECVRAGCGIDEIDLKGTLTDDTLAWLAYYRPRVPIVHFKPSGHPVPFNVFAARGEDPEEHAVRMAEVLLKCHGDDNASDFPMYREALPMLLAWCAATGESVQSASRLLHFHNRELSLTAADRMRTEHLKNKWRSAVYVKNERDWDYRFGSTRRKLEPFLHEGPLKRFTDVPGCLDYRKLRQEDGILLADLSGLSPETLRIFAALLIAQQLHACATSDEEIPRFAFYDEPQEYENSGMTSLLNLSRSAGLRISLIHHYSGQWNDQSLTKSCEANARIKYVMHGVPPDECRKLVESRLLTLVNERLHKQPRYRTEVSYEDEEVESVTETWNEYGEGHSITRSPRLRAVHETVIDGWDDYSREEKISMLMEPLVGLRKREYCLFTPDGHEWGEFEHLEDFNRLKTPEEILQFMETRTYPVHETQEPETDRAETSFAERSDDDEPRPRRTRKKGKVNLHRPE